MFEIKEITVTASCSKNYQKAEFTMTAMVECDEDIAAVKKLCTTHALDLLEGLPIKEETKTTTQPTTKAPVQNTGYKKTYEPKPVSDAQLKYIRSLGYTGPLPQTFDEADALLKQLKGPSGNTGPTGGGRRIWG